MSEPSPKPFQVKDCALAAIATGAKAQTLSELGDRIASAPLSSIHYHFWESRLSTAYEAREYHNDFANWAHNNLHDDVLAERLDLINPTDYHDLAQLRDDLIDLINNRVEELDIIPSVTKENRFEFIRSKIVVFWTPYTISEPRELVEIVPKLPHSSIFYHVIDATKRLPNRSNDFRSWLKTFGDRYEPLVEDLRKIDPYFIALPTLQERLIACFSEHLK